MWLRDLEESNRAIRTKITYRDVWGRHVQPAVGALRLRDARVSRIDAVMRELRERSGRIGELLALDWAHVDDTACTIAIEATVVRVPGQGLIVQPHTKSDAGMRTISPPS